MFEALRSVTAPFTNSTEQTLKECDRHPGKCLRQLLVDGAMIVIAYMVLLYAVDGQALGWRKAGKFYALFLGLAFVFRLLDLDYQDQLTRAAGFQLGSKLFMALAG
jgi:hypothetical protein